MGRLIFFLFLQNESQGATDLEADWAHVIVLLKLFSCSSGQGANLLGCFLSEQEALPAGLSSEPDIEVRVDDDDWRSHPAPFTKKRLPGAVRNHAHCHHKLQHPADGVHPVDDVVQVLNRVTAKQLQHEEGIDQHGACDLGTQTQLYRSLLKVNNIYF